jgi:hypothetical protein
MRYLSILLLIGVTLKVNGQQINPVPDYIFRNSMSVGRNAPTDTSAYFSIGPRFGATRGFMPPMVTDTASVTGTKRNGLLIYSIQSNSFLYWDSTGSRWSRIAANLDTLQLSTRAWRQKGIDSLASVRVGGSGTINRMPKFTAAGTIGNGSIVDSSASVRMTILSDGKIGVATTAPVYNFDVAGIFRSTGTTLLATTASNEVIVGGTADAGVHTLQVIGNIYNTTGAVFAATSGNVGIGTTTALYKLDVRGDVLVTSAATAGVVTPTPGLVVVGGTNVTVGAPGTLSLENADNSMETNDIIGNLDFYSNDASSGYRGVQARISGIVEEAAGLKSGIALYTGTSAALTERVRFTSDGETLFGTSTDAGDFRVQVSGNFYVTNNVGIGQTTFGTSAAKVMAFNNGTAPSTSPADAFQLYSADITAGNAAAHFRTENGAVIKIYQETTGVAGATRAAVAGNTVSDADTFDGYTVPQIVKALRNLGILQ